MAIASARTVSITYSGDAVGTQNLAAAANTLSGGIEVKTLASGANTITVPVVTGIAVPTAVTIVPPSGNLTSITLKGVTGDTGIALHLTDPTTIALASSVANFVLTAGAQILGVKLYWS